MKYLLKLTLLGLLAIAPARAQSKAEPPVPVRMVPPVFPEEMRRQGISGVVTVKCTIDEQGNVKESKVEKSSDAIFEKPALEAVQRWKFKPAKQDGNPVSAHVSIPIKFVAES